MKEENMTTKKQIQANQENALLSTGAVTQEGKNAISRNAIKHGIFAKDLIVKSELGQENEEEYLELVYELVESLSPQGKLENLLVEKIAIDFWRLRRVIRFETGSIGKYLNDVLKDYYNPWKSGEKHLPADAIDKKLKETKSYIEWNKKYIVCLKKGIVKFDKPTWEGREVESDIEDDLYMIANRIDQRLLSEDERKKLEYGELKLSALKKIIARAGYNTNQEITDELIKFFTNQNEKYEKEIDDLKEQKTANGIADELNVKLCSLPPCDNLEKVLKYEKSIQKSIFQNLIMLKKLQNTL